MDLHPTTARLQCPNCGANLLPGQTSCTACGAPLLTQENKANRAEELRPLIEAANQKLVEAGTASAESAFGLGCSLALMIVVVVTALAFFLSGRNWIVMGLFAAGTTIGGTAAAAALASRARDATVRATFGRSVRPEIEQFLQAHRIERSELAQHAAANLPPDAPLLRFIPAPAAASPQPSEV